MRKNPSEQIKYYQTALNTNIVIVDSANQSVEGQVNQVPHKSPNPFEHNAYGVEAKTRPQDRQATRPCHYCANCYSETTLRKYADSQRQLKAKSLREAKKNKQQASPPPQSNLNCQLHRGKRLLSIQLIRCFPFFFSLRCS